LINILNAKAYAKALYCTHGLYEYPHKRESAINEDRNKEETPISPSLSYAYATTNSRTKRRRRLVSPCCTHMPRRIPAQKRDDD